MLFNNKHIYGKSFKPYIIFKQKNIIPKHIYSIIYLVDFNNNSIILLLCNIFRIYLHKKVKYRAF